MDIADYKMHDYIKTFKVLSDETRLRTLNLVLERECCVCEVMQALEISQPKASRALSALHDAGLLQLRKDGLWSLYSVDKRKLADYSLKIIEAVAMDLEQHKLGALDKERLKKAVRRYPAGKLSPARKPAD
jgi:ArsR family transcriptional regulator, arsenate/arsenite/antimonite-responsive transcriptional repressor